MCTLYLLGLLGGGVVGHVFGSVTWVMTPRLGRVWVDSTTGWSTSWWGGNPGEDGTDYGSTPRWWMRCQRRGCRRWRPTSPTTRTQTLSLLQPGPLWNCVWRRSGGQGQWWTSDGWISTYWIWRGCGRRLGRPNRWRGRRRRAERRRIKLVGG